MEASENPQLPIGDGPEGTVRVLDDRVVIENLTVEDERAAQLVRDRRELGQEPTRTVADAIEIGARMLDREEATVEVDFVRREFERVVADDRKEFERRQRESVERIEGEVKRAFGDGEASGLLAAALSAHQEEITALIDENFGENSDQAIPKRIQELIEQRNREFLERLSADDELNPLRPLLSQFSNWVRERRETQDERDEKLEEKFDEFLNTASELLGLERAQEAIAAAEEAGTRKGFSFEERVHASIERIASTRGDCATHTGGEGAEGGGKKGDTLVELGAAEGPAAGRIVFEAKDKKLSKNAAWKELNEGMSARAASFGILVVAGEERVPSGREALVEYEGNKMIVALDREEPDGLALEVAYKLAAARVAMARDRDLEVDAVAVRDTAAEALTLLQSAQSIRSTLTHIKTTSDNARAGLDSMVAAVREKLERVEALVAEEAEASTGAAE